MIGYVNELLNETLRLLKDGILPSIHFHDNKIDMKDPPSLSNALEHPEKAKAIDEYKCRFSI